jgi:succinate dehydrogenase hydrophobic anchor subunit
MRDQALWTWHLGAGILIAVLLGTHMAIMHLNLIVNLFNPAGGHPIEWANVVARAKSAGFMIFYILLLGAGLFHGLYGLRNILLELNPSRGTRQFITALVLIGGLGLFAYGTWAAIVSFQHAAQV